MDSVTEVDLLTPRHAVKKGEPAWDIALLFPPQGQWTEEEYLALHTNWLIELSEGCLEVLPMPTPFHQRIAQYLFKLLEAWVLTHAAGEVFIAPLRVRLWAGKIREPDVVFLRPGRVYNPLRPPEGADLVMEVVSGGPKDRERDLEVKREEYAEARIAEYWIVDPHEQRVTVLVLDGERYRVHGQFAPGAQATSVLFPGFTVDVAAAFAAGEGPAGAAEKNGE
jgi:Uma2 family endonuclease